MAAAYLGLTEYVRPPVDWSGAESVGRGTTPVPVEAAVRTSLDVVRHAQRNQGWHAAYALLVDQVAILCDRYGEPAVVYEATKATA